MADYGYLHLGRVIGYDLDSGGYLLESVGLARTSKWGPTPSCVPGLKKSDRVVLGATGTSRDNLVILAKVGAAFPDVADIAGLLEALADKARAVDLDQTNAVVAGQTANLDYLNTTVAEHGSHLIQLDDYFDNLNAIVNGNTYDIGLLQNNQPFTYGNDVDINDDYLSSCPRWSASSTVPLSNGQAVYTRLETRRDITITTIKLAFANTGVPTAGILNVALYAGTDNSALPFTNSGTVGRVAGRADFIISGGGQPTVPAGSTIVVGILPTGMAGGETWKVLSTPALATHTLLNQDGNQLTSVIKNGQSALATTLKLDSSADWDTIGTAIIWTALGGIAP